MTLDRYQKNVVYQLKDTDVILFLIPRPSLVRYFNYRAKCITRTRIQSDQICYYLWYAITNASHTLKLPEKNCCQSEKRILSIAFACEKILENLYGRKFSIYIDYLLLKSIFKRSLTKALPSSKIFTKTTKEQSTVADVLSRAPHLYGNYIISSFEMSEKRLEQFANETSKDSFLFGPKM